MYTRTQTERKTHVHTHSHTHTHTLSVTWLVVGHGGIGADSRDGGKAETDKVFLLTARAAQVQKQKWQQQSAQQEETGGGGGKVLNVSTRTHAQKQSVVSAPPLHTTARARAKAGREERGERERGREVEREREGSRERSREVEREVERSRERSRGREREVERTEQVWKWKDLTGLRVLQKHLLLF